MTIWIKLSSIMLGLILQFKIDAQLVEFEGDLRVSSSVPEIELFDNRIGEERIEFSLRESADNFFITSYYGNLSFQPEGPFTKFQLLANRTNIFTASTQLERPDGQKVLLGLKENTGGTLFGFDFEYDGGPDQLNLWSRSFSDNEAIRMIWHKNGDVQIPSLAGNGDRSIFVDSDGRLNTSGTRTYEYLVSAFDFVNYGGGSLSYSQYGVTSSNVITGDDMIMVANIALPVGARITQAEFWGVDSTSDGEVTCRIRSNKLSESIPNNTFWGDTFGSASSARIANYYFFDRVVDMNVPIIENEDYFIHCQAEDSDNVTVRAIKLHFEINY